MADLASRLEKARPHARPEWGDERAAVVLRGVLRRRRDTRVRHVVAAGAGGALLLVFGVCAAFVAERRAHRALPVAEVHEVHEVHEAPTASAAPPAASIATHEVAADPPLDEPWVPRVPSAAPMAVAPKMDVAETSVPSVSWRALAARGSYDAAYAALHREGGVAAVHDDVRDLLLAADVARLSRHADEAVSPLRAVLVKHAGDARAPAAAFTLGRVLLDQLGRPAEAAAAFAQSRALAPGGPLAEDALAREAEARAHAGDAGGARVLAEEYLRKYPGGTRARALRGLVPTE